jgi:hypothetical protein
VEALTFWDYYKSERTDFRDCYSFYLEVSWTIMEFGIRLYDKAEELFFSRSKFSSFFSYYKLF